MKNTKKEKSFGVCTRGYKEELRMSRTKKYPLLGKDHRMGKKRVSVPLMDSVFTQMEKIEQSIIQEQIKTAKLQLSETNKFLLDLKQHWKSLITRLSLTNPHQSNPETPLHPNYSTYLSKQSLLANQIIRLRSLHQLYSKKTSKHFEQLSSLRGRSI